MLFSYQFLKYLNNKEITLFQIRQYPSIFHFFLMLMLITPFQVTHLSLMGLVSF